MLVNQHIVVDDRENHDGTEPGYRKANANIILSTPPVPLVPTVYRVVVVLHYSVHRTRVGRWQCTDGLAPDTSYVWLRSPRGFCCTRRPTSDRVTILIDIPRLSLEHDQLPFLFLLIYLFSIKENNRERGELSTILSTPTYLRDKSYIPKEALFHYLVLR